MAAEPPQNLERTLFGGPLQGRAEEMWNDVYSGIHQIIVVYGADAIDSIHIQYDNNGRPLWVVRGGGSTGNQIGKIRLNYPREILTRISGHSDTYLRSLKFESNEKEYETYGTPRGTPFESPNGDWKIVGFHGWSDSYFYGIGVSLSSFPKGLQRISFGPWGGEAADAWDDGVYSGIHQIIVVYGDDAIDSIHIQYDNNGSPFWKELGGSAENRTLRSLQSVPGRIVGNQIGKIQLHYPHEILTSISGHYDTYLRSLTFESNLGKKYGPYGSERGTPFESPRGDWKIVGFHGRSSYLGFRRQNCSCFYDLGVSLSFFPLGVKPISVGPWGGNDGDNWDDDKVYSGIHQILVVYDVNAGAIGSIDIQYHNNGSRFWLGHGRSTGKKIEKIQLDYPTEILTSISGYYRARGGISSLTFESNLEKSWTYGRREGTYFSIPIMDGKIVGFYGRSDEFLGKIGVHLSNLDTAVYPKCVKVGPWGEGEGEVWDDGPFSGIRGIGVGYHEGAICFIRIVYAHNGGTVTVEHGEITGNNDSEPANLDAGDIITSISGYYDTCLRSLTFDVRSLNPYTMIFTRGSTRRINFKIPIGDGKIVGFHGRSDEYLRAIGVYLSN